MKDQSDKLNVAEMKTLELQLVEYSQLYVLIGMLEDALQRVIPAVLKPYAQKHGLRYWYEGLPLSDKGENALRVALNRSRMRANANDGLNAHKYLPLSFWRYLIRSTTYTELWTPALYRAFPNLTSAKEFSTFKILDKKLGTALMIRNYVAHYELEEIHRVEESIQAILWLLNSLDFEMTIFARNWLTDTSRHGPIR